VRLPKAGAQRRIVAILATFSWSPDGEIYPVREGRNYIGSDPECDICVTQDPQLSSRHATILNRGKGAQFIIDDEKSMNGTLVNGVNVEMKQPLGNYARISTGATAWTFIILEPSPGE
ncbi:MAG: FHA domain-containing protein, partial [Blastocatellia bacterium]